MHQCADRQILALKYSHSCSHKHVYVNGNLKNINLTVNISPSVRCICNSLELLLGMMQVQLRFWMQESHEKTEYPSNGIVQIYGRKKEQINYV